MNIRNNRMAVIGLSIAAGLILWFCAFLLFRIAEGTEIPAIIVSSPLSSIALLLAGERAMIVGFLLTPAYWVLMGWAASWRSNRRTPLLIVLLLAQYLGAAATISLTMPDGFESHRFHSEMLRQPIVSGVFFVGYVLAHLFFWYCAAPRRLAD